MSANSEQVLKAALALETQERAELVERLLATFQSPPDPRIDELWAGEGEERLAAYDRGEIASVPAKEVFDKIGQRRQK